MTTHTAIATTAKGVIDAIQVNVPEPGAGQVRVKIQYASLMAFDVYVVDVGFFVQAYPQILGFNAAGTIDAVGPDVKDLAIGNPVTSLALSSRSVQEYAILGANECSKVPPNLTLQSAATIPDNFVTAFYVLFDQLKLPIPTELPALTPPPNADSPILIYGSGSTAGQYSIQLLKLAGYTRIITTASPKHHESLRSFGAAHIIDYNSPTFTDEIVNAAGGKVPLALDCVSAEDTLAAISKVLSPDGTVAVLVPVKEGNAVIGAPGSELLTSIPDAKNPFPKTVNIVYVSSFTYQANDYLRENLFQKVLPPLLASGAIKPNKVRLMDQGSLKDRVAAGLDLLRNNKVSGEKVIIKLT